MDREEIIRLANEAGLGSDEKRNAEYPNGYREYCRRLERFAKLIAKAERDRCCSPEITNSAGINGNDAPHIVVEKYRAAIRATGESCS